jgi:hypothetical protein
MTSVPLIISISFFLIHPSTHPSANPLIELSTYEPIYERICDRSMDRWMDLGVKELEAYKYYKLTMISSMVKIYFLST